MNSGMKLAGLLSGIFFLVATSSQYSQQQSKRFQSGNIGNRKMPNFKTKKEKEAKEKQDKKAKEFLQRQKRLRELEKEIEEMQALVFDKIKDPQIKRRISISDFRFLEEKRRINPETDKESMPSCYGVNVDFEEYRLNKEEYRLGRLEWRAQFKKIGDIVSYFFSVLYKLFKNIHHI